MKRVSAVLGEWARERSSWAMCCLGGGGVVGVDMVVGVFMGCALVMEEFVALYFVGSELVCTVAWCGLRWSGSWTAKNVLISLSLSGSSSTPSSQAYHLHTDHSKT